MSWNAGTETKSKPCLMWSYTLCAEICAVKKKTLPAVPDPLYTKGS